MKITMTQHRAVAANTMPVPEFPPGAALVPAAFKQLLAEHLGMRPSDKKYIVGRWITRVIPGQRREPTSARPLTTLAQAKGYWLMSVAATPFAELKEALVAAGASNVKQHPSPLPAMNVAWFDLPKKDLP